MAKQSEWSKKFAEKAQSGAQEIASCVQQGQTQCTDIISKLMSQQTEWAKTAFQGSTFTNGYTGTPGSKPTTGATK